MISPMEKLQLHEQEERSSCASAVIRMMLLQLGIDIPEKQIIRAMKLTDDGAGWNDIKSYLFKNHHIASDIIRNASWETLLQQPPDCLRIICYQTKRVVSPEEKMFLHPDLLIEKDPDDPDNSNSHFALVVEMDDESVTLADPSFGDIFVLNRKKFLDSWWDDEGRQTVLIVQGKPEEKQI